MGLNASRSGSFLSAGSETCNAIHRAFSGVPPSVSTPRTAGEGDVGTTYHMVKRATPLMPPALALRANKVASSLGEHLKRL